MMKMHGLFAQKLRRATVYAVMASSVLLSACGFHLLGGTGMAQELPHAVALIGNTDNEIVDFMRAQKPDNVRFAPAEQADLTVEIGDISTGKAVLSTTSEGVTSEFRINQSVVLQMYDANKRQLLPPTRLTTYRNLIVGRGYATAEDSELERLNTDMAQELANSIVYRARAVWFAQQTDAPKINRKASP